jgi:hypothetical protein
MRECFAAYGNHAIRVALFRHAARIRCLLPFNLFVCVLVLLRKVWGSRYGTVMTPPPLAVSKGPIQNLVCNGLQKSESSVTVGGALIDVVDARGQRNDGVSVRCHDGVRTFPPVKGKGGAVRIKASAIVGNACVVPHHTTSVEKA